jgi:hypothetical protein
LQEEFGLMGFPTYEAPTYATAVKGEKASWDGDCGDGALPLSALHRHVIPFSCARKLRSLSAQHRLWRIRP